MNLHEFADHLRALERSSEDWQHTTFLWISDPDGIHGHSVVGGNLMLADALAPAIADGLFDMPSLQTLKSHVERLPDAGLREFLTGLDRLTDNRYGLIGTHPKGIVLGKIADALEDAAMPLPQWLKAFAESARQLCQNPQNEVTKQGLEKPLWNTDGTFGLLANFVGNAFVRAAANGELASTSFSDVRALLRKGGFEAAEAMVRLLIDHGHKPQGPLPDELERIAAALEQIAAKREDADAGVWINHDWAAKILLDQNDGRDRYKFMANLRKKKLLKGHKRPGQGTAYYYSVSEVTKLKQAFNLSGQRSWDEYNPDPKEIERSKSKIKGEHLAHRRAKTKSQ